MKTKSTFKAARVIRKSRLTYLSVALVVGLILGLASFAAVWAADEVTLGGYTFKFNGVTYNLARWNIHLELHGYPTGYRWSRHQGPKSLGIGAL